LWYPSSDLLGGWIEKCIFHVRDWTGACVVGVNTPFFVFRVPSIVQIGQLYRIFSTLGTPNEDCWPGVGTLPEWQHAVFPRWAPQDLAAIVPALCPDGINLLGCMLKYTPEQRISCQQALEHPYFDPIRGQPTP
jgi:serine/threonine protein kinase